MTSRNFAKLAVDANVVLAAVLNGNALRIFRQLRHTTKFLTTESAIAEVREYIPRLAEKKGLNKEDMYKLLDLLPITVVPDETFQSEVASAIELISQRDPDDIPLVALALAMGCPVISQDRDIRDLKQLQVYTIAEMMVLMESEESH